MEWYDRRWYDREWYDEQWYDKRWYDKEGFDKQWFDINGLNKVWDSKYPNDIYRWMPTSEITKRQKKIIHDLKEENVIIKNEKEKIITELNSVTKVYSKKEKENNDLKTK